MLHGRIYRSGLTTEKAKWGCSCQLGLEKWDGYVGSGTVFQFPVSGGLGLMQAV